MQTTEQLFARIAVYLEGSPKKILIVDLQESQIPNAEIRAHIRQHIKALGLERFCVVVGENMLIKIAARFVVGSLGFKNTEAYGNVREAIADLTGKVNL